MFCVFFYSFPTERFWQDVIPHNSTDVSILIPFIFIIFILSISVYKIFLQRNKNSRLFMNKYNEMVHKGLSHEIAEDKKFMNLPSTTYRP